mgnify:CR=1 FL=1
MINQEYPEQNLQKYLGITECKQRKILRIFLKFTV